MVYCSQDGSGKIQRWNKFAKMSQSNKKYTFLDTVMCTCRLHSGSRLPYCNHVGVLDHLGVLDTHSPVTHMTLLILLVLQTLSRSVNLPWGPWQVCVGREWLFCIHKNILMQIQKARRPCMVILVESLW